MKRDAVWWKPLYHLVLFNSTGLPVSGVLWFLTCLFFMELFFGILHCKNNFWAWSLYLICYVVCLILNIIFRIRLPWSIDTAIINLPFYYVGYLLRKHQTHKGKGRLLNLNWICATLVLLVGSLLAFINGYVNLRNAYYGFIPLFYIAAVLICVGIWNFSRIIDSFSKLRLVCGSLQRIGRESIVYLCTNQIVIMVVTLGMEKLHIDMYASTLINGLLCLASVLFIETLLRVFFTTTPLKICIGK